MATQSKTWQRKILADAAQINYEGLYWYIEASRAGKDHSAGWYPKPYIPVIPVGPDEKASYNYASFLAWFFNVANPDKHWTFTPSLTTAELLKDIRWYIWTEDIWQDAICNQCGAVDRLPFLWVEMEANYICMECIEKLAG